ncbi:MAG TPA: type I-E CRISPR-associated protein Cas5/CasD [Actinocrinis sp.]|nr:type I-E CRISPR-associated protein Cas5/CasD [Actinocrinis sp.]
MTATLLLRLDGPMQAWSVAEFSDRPTMPFPTKSGIVGLLANAHGRSRGDGVEDLAGLAAAVRADDAGRPMTDFQTAGRDGWRSADGRLHTDTYKTRRKGYLLDAVFTVALTGDDEVIDRSADAIRHPARPLFLGRRCCPPATPLLIGVSAAAAGLEALRDVPYQGHKPVPPERFMVAIDADEGEVWDDHPVTYLGDRREHRPRCVVITEITYTGRGER